MMLRPPLQLFRTCLLMSAMGCDGGAGGLPTDAAPSGSGGAEPDGSRDPADQSGGPSAAGDAGNGGTSSDGMGGSAASEGGASASGGGPSMTGVPGAGGDAVGGEASGGTTSGGNASGGSASGGSASGSGAAGGNGPNGTGGGGSASAGVGGTEPDPVTTGGAASGGSASGGDASGGAGGNPSAGGSGGSLATPDICSFDLEGSLSPEIPTVGVVEWSTDLEGVTDARIEFTLNSPEDGELNVGSGGPISVAEGRALMLGLKPERSYTYRIVVSAGETECVSENRSLTTGIIPSSPTLTPTLGEAVELRAKGFVVTCLYIGNGSLIIDADGDVVWRYDSPDSCSRAHMDWEGEYMWSMASNPATGSSAGADNGEVRRVRMDGSDEEDIPGLERSHHDFAVLPDGDTAYLVVAEEGDTEILERSPEGEFDRVVLLNETGYLTGNQFHPNALRYYQRDDSYTVSDVKLSAIAHFDRQGQILWLLSDVELAGTHGHQLLDNGNLIFFKAGYGSPDLSGPSAVIEYSLVEQGGDVTATQEWEYVGDYGSLTLGDVLRLPNGNTLVVYSTEGILLEVSPAGDVVQTLELGGRFGYASFRETLYGPPQ